MTSIDRPRLQTSAADEHQWNWRLHAENQRSAHLNYTSKEWPPRSFKSGTRALRDGFFIHNIVRTRTHKWRREPKLNSPHFRVWRKIRLRVRLLNIVCVYICVYGQFVWDLIIARILFRPRISLGTGLAVPIVSQNTASSLYILFFRGISVDVYILIYIYTYYIYSCVFSRNVSAVRLSLRKSPLWLENPVDLYIYIYYIPTGSGPAVWLTIRRVVSSRPLLFGTINDCGGWRKIEIAQMNEK